MKPARRPRARVSSHGYPRPQLQREQWTSLDGPWDFAIDAEAAWTRPEQVRFDRTILVPFAPETPASGIHETGFYNAIWYRRTFEPPALDDGRRLLLHFGAVDDDATVWVNGQLAIQHRGGYVPFQIDVTDLLEGDGPQTIIVRAFDDPHDLSKPRGKQDWQLHPARRASSAISHFSTTDVQRSVRRWLAGTTSSHTDCQMPVVR